MSGYFDQTTRNHAGRSHGDLYMHPFKVLVANNLVRVIPGRVYTLADGRMHDAFVVQLSSTDLGDPFLLQTMPTLAVQNNAWLWVKVEFDPDDGSVVSADVVYETEANAQDTYEIRWIKLAKTYSSGLVEQILKENIFISCPDDGMFFKVSKVSNSSVTVQGLLERFLPLLPSTSQLCRLTWPACRSEACPRTMRFGCGWTTMS